MWNLRKKARKYIDKMFKEKVGKQLKSELLQPFCKSFIIKQLQTQILKGA